VTRARPRPRQARPLTCDCGQDLIFARTRNRRAIPLNKTPDPEGNVAAYRDTGGVWRARVLAKDEQPAPHEKRYQTHFATCPDAGRHRKPKPARNVQEELL
jgi:hypothetical protein